MADADLSNKEMTVSEEKDLAWVSLLVIWNNEKPGNSIGQKITDRLR